MGSELDVETPADLAEALEESLEIFSAADRHVGLKRGQETEFRAAVRRILGTPAPEDILTSIPEQETEVSASSTAATEEEDASKEEAEHASKEEGSELELEDIYRVFVNEFGNVGDKDWSCSAC